MKALLRHRFENYEVKTDTEVLIVGTFNPETPNNEAKFFYGRTRNHLWRLLPTAYQHADLKGKNMEAQEAFVDANKIAFTDLIVSIEVDIDQATNYSDAFIEKHAKDWNDIPSLIQRLDNLKKVVITRMSFSDVPCIKQKVESIQAVCLKKGILFACLPTPARFYNEKKQSAWNEILAR